MNKELKETLTKLSKNGTQRFLVSEAKIDIAEPKKLSKKVSFVIDSLRTKKIGYTIPLAKFTATVCKEWGLTFASSDVISATDVIKAIKELYRLVAIGELIMPSPAMYIVTNSVEGTTLIRCVPFKEGYYHLMTEEESMEKAKKVEEKKASKGNGEIEDAGANASTSKNRPDISADMFADMSDANLKDLFKDLAEEMRSRNIDFKAILKEMKLA